MQLHCGIERQREPEKAERAKHPTMSLRDLDDKALSERVGKGDFGLSDDTARFVLITLRQRCRAFPISPQDRDDLVQDVAMWVARHRIASRPITRAWLWSTLSRFAWNVRYAQRRETALEDLPLGMEPTRAPRRASASIEELTRNLGKAERRVVELLLEGHTWEFALRQIGICHGTHSRWRARLRRVVNQAVGR